MSILISLCHLKIEIDKSIKMDDNSEFAFALFNLRRRTSGRNNFSTLGLLFHFHFIWVWAGSEGAAAPISVRTNPNHDQRQPKKITVESFSNNQLESCENKGILPSGSRETTPMAAETMQLAEYVDEKGFFSGNPFVEVTKGIIHIYKRKWVMEHL